MFGLVTLDIDKIYQEGILHFTLQSSIDTVDVIEPGRTSLVNIDKKIGIN